MASTTFVNYQTVIDAAWLNDVNSAVYSGTFQASTITPTNITSSGAISGATVAGTTSVTTPIVKSGTSLTLQTNGSTTALTLDTSQNATFAGKVASASSLQLATNGTTTAVTIDTNQNVGVGVTPSAWSTSNSVKAIQLPAASLWSYASTNAYFAQNVFFNGTNRVYLSTNPASEYVQTLGQHQWFNAPSGTVGTTATLTQAMTLDANSNLLVGTTSAVSNQGVIQAKSAQTGGAGQYSAINTNYNSGANNWTFGMNSAGAFVVYINPTVGGNNGVYLSAGATSWTANSDERLKDVTGEIENALVSVNAIRAVKYTLKADDQETKTQRVGFIAQDVQAVLPEIVDENAEGYLGIRYAEITPLLVKAIQELSAQVTTLQTQVTALQAKG